MKLSNLIFAFILAVITSLSLQSQSNSSHVISINDDDGSYHIEYTDGEVTVLKIDGVTIPEEDYDSYQHIIDKYKQPSNPDHNSSRASSHYDDTQTKLQKKIVKYLSKNEGLNKSKYQFKLTTKYLKLNGKKLSAKRLNDCLGIFENITGNAMTRGSYFHVDIAPGSRSVSLSIED